MKKTFITIASLALFATVAQAASYELEAPPMSAYVVTVPRQTEIERAIESSLAELREAAKPAAIKVAAPALWQPGTVQPVKNEQLAQDLRSGTTRFVAVKA